MFGGHSANLVVEVHDENKHLMLEARLTIKIAHKAVTVN